MSDSRAEFTDLLFKLAENSRSCEGFLIIRYLLADVSRDGKFKLELERRRPDIAKQCRKFKSMLWDCQCLEKLKSDVSSEKPTDADLESDENCVDGDQIWDYVDGELTEEETLTLIKHFQECKFCREYMIRFRDEVDILKAASAAGENIEHIVTSLPIFSELEAEL